ncbi:MULTISPECIES: DUF3993 domain-containing protein [Bacillus]|uniref:DUF3993 domain-containing protein n=1 Tax=Bacillus TaxID=1386 RepID=UPI0012FF3FBF|nr:MULTISPECIES: DUF3993 domain-containing protein [Bacillus]
MKNFKSLALIASIFCLFFLGNIYTVADNQSSNANEPTREEILDMLQEAFHAQYMLSEKYRDLNEIEELLSTYFTTEYIKKFSTEHLFKEEQGYITYGTDFAIFYVPFYSYDDKTKVKFDEKNNVYHIYEFFRKETARPSLFPDHYQWVSIKKGPEGWLIYDYGMQQETPSFLNEYEES